MEVESINKHPKKRSHKRIGKKVKSLLLSEDYFTDDRLVRAFRRANITPTELSAIASGLIEICGGNKDSFNLICSYIAKQYNNLTTDFLQFLRKTGLLQKTFWCIGTTKLVKRWILVKRRNACLFLNQEKNIRFKEFLH